MEPNNQSMARNDNGGSEGDMIVADLPNSIKEKVSDFLPAKDVSSLSKVSKSMHGDLSLSTLSPGFVILNEASWYGDVYTGDTIRCCYDAEIPVLCPNRTHTIRVSCEWQDQGWGNQKGALWIVGHSCDDKDEDEDEDEDAMQCENGGLEHPLTFDTGRLVATSPIAPHSLSTLQLSFQPKSNERYFLWYRVGGGGGHSLHVKDVHATSLIYDDEELRLTNAYRFLSNIGGLKYETSSGAPSSSGFYNKLFLETMKMLRLHLSSTGESRGSGNAAGDTASADDGKMDGLFSLWEEYGLANTKDVLLLFAVETLMSSVKQFAEEKMKTKQQAQAQVQLDDDDDDDDSYGDGYESPVEGEYQEPNYQYE